METECLTRDTTTGAVFEEMVLSSLEKGGYLYTEQILVGKRPGSRKHFVDTVATKNNESILISLKWQQQNGTAEQKIVYEIISLSKALTDNGDKYRRAYIVLGGEAWTLRKFSIDGGFNEYLNLSNIEKIKIVTFENFVYLANKGILSTLQSVP